MEARTGGRVALEKTSADEERPSGKQLFVARFDRDVCTVSADSSGALLHMRGYRGPQAKAPLRETLAAALLLASGWTGETPLSDRLSIMCYQLPGEITIDVEPIVGGDDIDALDQQFVGEVYPLAVTPPPPPTAARVFGLKFPAATGKGQRVTFLSPVSFPAGEYDVIHHGTAVAAVQAEASE